MRDEIRVIQGLYVHCAPDIEKEEERERERKRGRINERAKNERGICVSYLSGTKSQ